MQINTIHVNGAMGAREVPDEAVATARFLARKADIQEIVAIELLESFLSQNIEELSEFKKDAFKERFVELIV